MAEKTSKSPKSITVVVRRTVKNGREADYEQWVKDTTADLKTFPGFMDITVIRPQVTPANERSSSANKDKSKEYVLIIHFDTLAHVDNWEKSEARNKWLKKAEDFTEKLDNQRITGLEYWFPLPEIPKAAVPPRYKMVVVTILAIFPLSLVVNYLFNLIPFSLPFLLRGLLVSTAMVSSMTYFVMPFMTSIFRNWLFPQKK